MVKAAAAQRYAEKTQSLASDVGQRIRRARLDRGLSLAQVGGDDLSRSFLSLVELGRSRISLRALAIVSERLNLPMSYFLESAEGSPEALADLQLDEAEAALRQDKPKAALALLNKTEIPEALRGRQLWLQGWAEREVGRPREAINTLHQARMIVREGEDRRLRVQVDYELASALKDAGNYEEAVVYLRRAQDELDGDLGEEGFTAGIAAQLGTIQAARGQQEEAAASFERARSLLTRASSPDNISTAFAGIAAAYQKAGDLQEAARFSRLRLGALQVGQNRREAARELAVIAATSLEMGLSEDAIEYAQQAIGLASQAGAGQLEALARGTLAEIYAEQGKSEEARHEANLARELSGDESEISVGAWLALARVAERTGSPSEADELYAKVLSHLVQTGNGRRYANAAYEYSLVLKNRGDTEGALKFALEAASPQPTRSAV